MQTVVKLTGLYDSGRMCVNRYLASRPPIECANKLTSFPSVPFAVNCSSDSNIRCSAHARSLMLPVAGTCPTTTLHPNLSRKILKTWPQ